MRNVLQCIFAGCVCVWSPSVLWLVLVTLSEICGTMLQHLDGLLRSSGAIRSWLGHLHSKLPATAADTPSQGHGRRTRRHDTSSSYLVSCHLLSSYLSNAKDIGAVSALGTELIFPGCFTSSAVALANNCSTSLLRAHKVVFDAAYTLLKRSEFQVGRAVTRWSWGDSSPQGGKDWFQCKEQYIFDDELVAVADAVDRLISGTTGTDITTPDEATCNALIESSVHVHMKMPMAKGEGHSGIEHLAACFVLSTFWEAGT
jgi:hypothetical protein